ncbi:MAG: hypothetical protein ACF8CQ_19250, partial [Rhodopirellula sp. JB044]
MTGLHRLVLGCFVAALFVCATAAPAQAGVCCAPAPVCCPPPPVEVSWCVMDPRTCCTYPVSACVPACCAGTQPCLVSCRKGFLGRIVLTYKFPCCDHCVEVV